MIKGNNIYLRPIVKNDIDYLNKWKNDEETYKYLGGGFMPTSINQQEKWLDSIIDSTGQNRRFIICEKPNFPIGIIGLYSINWIHRTSEIGIFIGEKSAKGKGYAKEACILLENYAKNYLNLRKLKLFVVNENTTAYLMWQSLKYKNVGVLTKERYIDGEYKDLIIMEKFLTI